MKTLYLLRHGHAESKQKQPDVERNLDSQGHGEVERTAEKLKKVTPRPDLIMSSHANRALQTAEIAARAFDYNVKNIMIEQVIYRTAEETILDALRRQDNKYDTILLAGHNPDISELASDLTNNAFDDTMPTAGVVCIQSDVNSWEEFAPHNCRLGFTLEP